MSFFERLLVDVAKTAIKVVAKQTLSEKTYQQTSTLLTIIASVFTMVILGYFIFFLIAFQGYQGG